MALKAAESSKDATIHGRVEPGANPVLTLEDGRRIALQSDAPSMLVLTDERLKGMDLEAIGHFDSPGQFSINPRHTHAMFVLKDGKRMMITYWCDVCSIRYYEPGKCACCQKYTDLDLQVSDE